MTHKIDTRRRRLLGAMTAGAGGWFVSRTYAATVLPTPRQSAGPFYPVELPLDQDNDLASVAGAAGLADGEIVNVVGRLINTQGRAITGATIEIWQCDAHGRYRHPRERRDVPPDPKFQGYGRFVTGADGGYRFRTIQPVAYPGRAPHIHFAVHRPGRAPFTTQLYVAGAPENATDVLLKRITDPRARASVLVDFQATAAAAEPVGWFDIVLAA